MNARQKAKKYKKEIKKLREENESLKMLEFPRVHIDYEQVQKLRMYENIIKYMMITGYGPRSGMKLDKYMIEISERRELKIKEEYYTNSIVIECY